MKTFKGTASLDFKAVVPQQFLDELRAAAQAEDVPPFLKQVQLKHPVNDDAFLAAIIKNGIRNTLRDALLDIFAESGIGGTVAPAKIGVVESPEGFDDTPAVPQVIERTNETNQEG